MSTNIIMHSLPPHDPPPMHPIHRRQIALYLQLGAKSWPGGVKIVTKVVLSNWKLWVFNILKVEIMTNSTNSIKLIFCTIFNIFNILFHCKRGLWTRKLSKQYKIMHLTLKIISFIFCTSEVAFSFFEVSKHLPVFIYKVR